MRWPFHGRLAAAPKWDADIVRARHLPVPRKVQEQARELLASRSMQPAIAFVMEETGYQRYEARCVVLALMYHQPVPTHRPFGWLRRTPV